MCTPARFVHRRSKSDAGKKLPRLSLGEGQGKAVVMASYTFPHRVDQPLALLLKLQQQAITYMRGRRQYMALMGDVGFAGRIRTLEVTHGKNGWHLTPTSC